MNTKNTVSFKAPDDDTIAIDVIQPNGSSKSLMLDPFVEYDAEDIIAMFTDDWTEYERNAVLKTHKILKEMNRDFAAHKAETI